MNHLLSWLFLRIDWPLSYSIYVILRFQQYEILSKKALPQPISQYLKAKQLETH